MAFFRPTLIAAIVALLFVPAVTRAVQPLDVGSCSAHPSGFHKSGEIPPDPIVILPDVQIVFSELPAVWAPEGQPREEHDTLPAPPFVYGRGALRAPPGDC